MAKFHPTKILLSAALLLGSFSASADTLSGTPMGSDTQQAARCFDGNNQTYFIGSYPSTYYYVRNWAGLDLGESHVISRVGIRPAQGSASASRFAVVQGANTEDFSDALTIMVFKDALVDGTTNWLDINTSRGFRYVRVVATNTQGYWAEISFEGTPGQGDDSQFYQMTNLPLVSFVTPGMAEIKSKDDKHPGSYISIVSDGGTKILEAGDAQMKGRGNGSWTFPKKPFQIKFNKKTNVLDAPAKAKKWTLINNYGDRTLMRNKVAFEMSRVVGMEYTPYCTFVDVIYNGEYEGCYQLCDQVEAKSGRVELTEMLPEDVEGEALTGGYFIEIDAYANQEESWFTSSGGIPVTIKTPDEDEIVREQSLYIEDHFNKLESALFSSDFTDEELGYRRYLDLESFLKYFIICELDGNLDSFWSTYMKKERGDERFHVGPVWDVDLGFQNYGSPYPVDNMSDFLYTHQDASKANGMERFVSRIVKEDPLAAFQLNRLWFELRSDGTLSYEYFDQLIDQWAAELDESQRLNFTRWPILNQSVQKGQRVFGSYQGEINNVKSYLKARFPKLDSFFGYDELLAGITDISADGDSTTYPVEIYDLSGRRIKSSSLTPGIYIRRQGPKTEKFIVR